LLLRDLIKELMFLYIDTNTLPQIDVAPLFEMDMGQYATGFLVDGKVGTALESRFFRSLGMDPDGPAFNAGVMLVQRQQWEEQDCWNRILRFCQQYRNELLITDQTVLNKLTAKNCFHSPDAYNAKGYPRPNSVVGSAPHCITLSVRRNREIFWNRQTCRTARDGLRLWSRLPQAARKSLFGCPAPTGTEPSLCWEFSVAS
jgi:hypothetical protein